MGKVIRQPSGPFRDDEFEEYYIVPLTRGLGAKVSICDIERVAAYNWCSSRESRGTKDYAIRWEYKDGKRTKIRMHRFIMNLPPGTVGDGMVVDHLSDDGLDNRRELLEIITQEENMKRSKGWKKLGMKCEPSL